jgi:hypothetical protein
MYKVSFEYGIEYKYLFWIFQNIGFLLARTRHVDAWQNLIARAMHVQIKPCHWEYFDLQNRFPDFQTPTI